uniref:DNA polymerase II small subunit n=1 Tax=Pyrococcus horikoshii TaxID=53953 RepID=UPI0001E0708F|nr:Chain A, DNA polymerase II small subunit [Pyrococcus horikoshii]
GSHMDEFVKGLMKNGYLITPSAYYLLVGHFNEGKFSLIELIKFAKSRETFIIDDEIANEFLKSIGAEVELPQEIK